jgi:glutamate 5-kinase
VDKAGLLANARRLVIKAGSSLVQEGTIFRHDGLAGDLAARDGETILISSGAVALGRAAAPQIAGVSLAQRQALSAI